MHIMNSLSLVAERDTNTQEQPLNTHSAGLTLASPCGDSQSSSMSPLSRVSTGESSEQWVRCDSQTLGPPSSIDTADRIRKSQPGSILMDSIKRMHSWPKVEALEGGTNKGAKTTGQVAICGMGAVLVQPHPEAITEESSTEILKAGQIHIDHSLSPKATRSLVLTPLPRGSGAPSMACRPSVGIPEPPEKSSVDQTDSGGQRKGDKTMEYGSPSSIHKLCPAYRQYPTRSKERMKDKCTAKIISLKPFGETANIVLHKSCYNTEEIDKSLQKNLRSKVSKTTPNSNTDSLSKCVFPRGAIFADLSSDKKFKDKSREKDVDLSNNVSSGELRREVGRKPGMERRSHSKLKPEEAVAKWSLCRKNLGSLGNIYLKASASRNQQWKGSNPKKSTYKGDNSCRENAELHNGKISEGFSTCSGYMLTWLSVIFQQVKSLRQSCI